MKNSPPIGSLILLNRSLDRYLQQEAGMFRSGIGSYGDYLVRYDEKFDFEYIDGEAKAVTKHVRKFLGGYVVDSHLGKLEIIIVLLKDLEAFTWIHNPEYRVSKVCGEIAIETSHWCSLTLPPTDPIGSRTERLDTGEHHADLQMASSTGSPMQWNQSHSLVKIEVPETEVRVISDPVDLEECSLEDVRFRLLLLDALTDPFCKKLYMIGAKEKHASSLEFAVRKLNIANNSVQVATIPYREWKWRQFTCLSDQYCLQALTVDELLTHDSAALRKHGKDLAKKLGIEESSNL